MLFSTSGPSNPSAWSRIGGLAVLACSLVGVACDCRPTSPPPATAPATRPGTQAVETQPAATAPATAPATQPATAPATQSVVPPSTYDSRPPYTVHLFVLGPEPEQEQPGWLRIVEPSRDEELATCLGRFPRHNRIEIETANVDHLRLDIGFLPLAPKRRIILSIDGQTMELARRDRRYIWLMRSDTTGGWYVADSD